MKIICNLKNNFIYEDIVAYKKEIDKINTTGINFIICPSLPYLYNFSQYKVGAQDISAYDECITGEITGKQLSSLLIDYVIIGHAERRFKFKEDSELLNKKIIQANKNNIKVIYCISEESKDLENAKLIIKKQLDDVKSNLFSNAIIAYEPIWAIGQEIELDYDYLNEMINYISTLTNNEIVYGGHVTDTNIDYLLKNDKIKGFLLGNSALNINILHNIIRKVS